MDIFLLIKFLIVLYLLFNIFNIQKHRCNQNHTKLLKDKLSESN